jgi:hypothetical protein
VTYGIDWSEYEPEPVSENYTQEEEIQAAKNLNEKIERERAEALMAKGPIRLVRRVMELEAELEALRLALSFYAQQYGLGARLASDGGKIAREALQAATPERVTNG